MQTTQSYMTRYEAINALTLPVAGNAGFHGLDCIVSIWT